MRLGGNTQKVFVTHYIKSIIGSFWLLDLNESVLQSPALQHRSRKTEIVDLISNCSALYERHSHEQFVRWISIDLKYYSSRLFLLLFFCFLGFDFDLNSLFCLALLVRCEIETFLLEIKETSSTKCDELFAALLHRVLTLYKLLGGQHIIEHESIKILGEIRNSNIQWP
jgi:hypothetical protein